MKKMISDTLPAFKTGLRLFVAVSFTAISSLSLAAEPAMPVIHAPVGFDEGTETRLSLPQIEEVLPWAHNSEVALRDLLDTVKPMAPEQTLQTLRHSVESIVLASAPKQTELLMRYVLNRALKVIDEIQHFEKTSSISAIDQQIRVLKLSIPLALEYYKSDIEFLNGQARNQNSLMSPTYARFGVRYAQFLMMLDNSLLDAAVQYNVAVMAMGLLQWDLYRDSEKLAFAPIIHKLQSTLAQLPERADHTQTDARTLRQLRTLKTAFKKALALAHARVNEQILQTSESPDRRVLIQNDEAAELVALWEWIEQLPPEIRALYPHKGASHLKASLEKVNTNSLGRNGEWPPEYIFKNDEDSGKAARLDAFFMHRARTDLAGNVFGLFWMKPAATEELWKKCTQEIEKITTFEGTPRYGRASITGDVVLAANTLKLKFRLTKKSPTTPNFHPEKFQVLIFCDTQLSLSCEPYREWESFSTLSSQLNIRYVDTGNPKNQELLQQFEVKNAPTILYLKEGSVVRSETGFLAREAGNEIKNYTINQALLPALIQLGDSELQEAAKRTQSELPWQFPCWGNLNAKSSRANSR